MARQFIQNIWLFRMLLNRRQREDSRSDGEVGIRERRKWVVLVSIHRVIDGKVETEGEQCLQKSYLIYVVCPPQIVDVHLMEQVWSYVWWATSSALGQIQTTTTQPLVTPNIVDYTRHC